MSFKLKTKPKKPFRKSWSKTHEFYEPTVSDILAYLIDVDVHPDHAHLEVTGNDYYGHELTLRYTEYESIEDFNKRWAIYEDKLDEYKQWESENAEAIAREKAERKRKADEKKALQEEYKRKLKELEKK